MTAVPGPWAHEVLRVWFHELSSSDWYGGGEAVDRLLADRFSGLLDTLGAKPAEDFLSDPMTALAAILLFDQFPRNIHRGTPAAFAWDDKAQTIAKGMLEEGWTQALETREAQFALMPLMHSEELEDQDLSVHWFGKLAPGSIDFAKDHREAIARFGRFPHRNEILGRETTPEEQVAIDEGLNW